MFFQTQIAPRRRAKESGKGLDAGRICYHAAAPQEGLRRELGMDAHRFDDLFSEFGPIRLRRFFGGEGIVAEDVMIGMVFSDVIYFKTDEETRKAFAAENSKPFSFLKRSTGETIVTTWFALPDRLYDDPEELAQWARAALDVARKAPAEKKKRKAAVRKPIKKKKAR
ncbi:MAG TPA: TfoX/Sxy family protein [Rhizomicrobium sp.]